MTLRKAWPAGRSQAGATAQPERVVKDRTPGRAMQCGHGSNLVGIRRLFRMPVSKNKIH
jgi:hypothetical protein